MARMRNQENYDATRTRLLDVGEKLIRQKSFADTGVMDVLKYAETAKGSFYHYFKSKEDFGIEVARRYSEQQVEFARQMLNDDGKAPILRLRAFFKAAAVDMESRSFSQGCLMCNLTTELADENPTFQAELNQNWQELSDEIAQCLKGSDLATINLSHLSTAEAADWLLNAWSGALTRMKAAGNSDPLALFMKSVFKN